MANEPIPGIPKDSVGNYDPDKACPPGGKSMPDPVVPGPLLTPAPKPPPAPAPKPPVPAPIPPKAPEAPKPPVPPAKK
jgi:hypothetical protein